MTASCKRHELHLCLRHCRGWPAESRLLLQGDGRPTARPDIGPLPASGVLARARAFLPALQAANAALEARLQSEPAQSVDIEHLEGEGAPHIAMDLACGVMDLRDPAAEFAAERAVRGGAAPGEEERAGSDSDSEDSSDDEGGGAGDGDRRGDARGRGAGAPAAQSGARRSSGRRQAAAAAGDNRAVTSPVCLR